jgi:DNA-binding NarL/FixJ family response regulator
MQALAERARIVLAAADGFKNKEIAVKIGVCAATAAVAECGGANRTIGAYPV